MRAAPRDGPPAEQLLAVLEALVIELDNDADLKDLMMLDSRRVRKDNRDVLMTRGLQQFADEVEVILGAMRRHGQLRSDLNLDAVRAAIMGLTEGLIRDQVVARRSGFRADYGFADVRKVLEVLVLGLNESVQPLKAAHR